MQRLASERITYLDYTGAPPFPASLLAGHLERLQEETLGNPHASHPASAASSRMADEAAGALLRFVDADPGEYEVVWTANASAAIRLVAESFPFGPGAPCVLTADNHNAVNGVREYARQRGASIRYLPLDADLRLAPFALQTVANGLFAFPAQSNFSGVRHPLPLVDVAQAHGYRVLLDAAAFVPGYRLSLRTVRADYVALSLYKICGYPTGLGALIARRHALRQLSRPAFSGGVVEFVGVTADRYRLKSGAAGFEDGTGNFLSWPAVRPALAFVEQLDLGALAGHTARLTARLLERLQALHWPSGAPAVTIYGPRDLHQRGATVAFNLLTASGAILDCEAVVELAAAEGICLRGGCFCNPGCAEHAFGYAGDELAHALDHTSAGQPPSARGAANDGRAVGAIRASLGYGSSADDVDRLVQCLQRCRDHLAACD